jgi:hypothetical protein
MMTIAAKQHFHMFILLFEQEICHPIVKSIARNPITVNDPFFIKK